MKEGAPCLDYIRKEVNRMKEIVIRINEKKHLSTVTVDGAKVFDAQQDDGYVELKADSKIMLLDCDFTVVRRMG